MGTEYHSKYLDNHWRFSVGGDINYVINQYKNLAGTTTTYNSGGNAGIDDRFTSVQTRDFLDGNSWAVNLHAEAEYRFDTRHALVFGAYYNQGLRPLLTKRFEPLTFNGTDHNITITNRGSYLAFMLGYKRRVFNPKGSVRERVAPRREHDPFDETPGQELERGGRLLAVNFFAQPFPGAPRQTYYVNAKAGWFYTDRWAVGPDIAYSRSTGVFSFGGTEWYAGAFLRHYLPGRKNRGLDVYFDLSVQRRWFRSELPNNRTFRYASWDLGLTPGVNWRIARQFRLDASARILNQYVPGGGISFLSNLWPQIGCNYIIR